MGALDAFANNPVSQLLALESDLPYARDVTLFFYALTVLRNSKEGSNFFSTFVFTFVRAFGAIGVLLPLVLGKLPGDVLGNSGLDNYAWIVFCAMVWNRFNVEKALRLPNFLNVFLGYCGSVSYSVVKANVCAQGYAAAGEALSGSFWAPFLGSYLAVQGAALVEDGVNAVNKDTFDEDGLLGLFGGVWFWVGAAHLDIAGSMANVVLALFHISNDFVSWTAHFGKFVSEFDNFVSNVGTGAASKRGRSRTPKRK